MIPVILSGGSGTRLWPLSRALKPKQFITLEGDLSLFQSTLARLTEMADGSDLFARPIIVCNEEHRFVVAEQSRALGIEPQRILLEPLAKNTAAAVAAATLTAYETGQDPILLVLSADHLITDVQAFKHAIDLARVQAMQGRIVTFGIVPSRPETGYGYIRTHSQALDAAAPVEAFVEKPDQATAERYVGEGNYLWNSGMFMFRTSVMKAELERLCPDVVTAVQAALAQATHDLDFSRLGKPEFSRAPSISIDYAVMEKTGIASVVPLRSGWSDIGAWDAVWEASKRDAQGNCSKGDVILHNVKNSYVHSTKRLVTVQGLDDVVVIETADAILVTTREQAQQVKQVVNILTSQQRSEVLSHREVFRPWGHYDSVDNGERYQVKRITVKPGHKLSVQLHHHRAEHWIVVSGTANVRIGNTTTLLTENQSTFIPLGVVHALENPGKIPLELIEVQSGSYLGEDDIIRFEDRYGRIEQRPIVQN